MVHYFTEHCSLNERLHLVNSLLYCLYVAGIWFHIKVTLDLVHMWWSCRKFSVWSFLEVTTFWSSYFWQHHWIIRMNDVTLLVFTSHDQHRHMKSTCGSFSHRLVYVKWSNICVSEHWAGDVKTFFLTDFI